MKVLHVITGLHAGGAEGVLYNLCSHDPSTVHVVVSLMKAGEYSECLSAVGVQVVHLNMPRGRVTPVGIARLYRVLQFERPDIVQTWMYHADLIGGLVARAVGTRNVFWGIRHSDVSSNSTKRSTRVVARVCATLSRMVPAGIIACAEAAAQAHADLGYDSDRMVVVENGYDLDRFRVDPKAREGFRSEFSVLDGEILLGMVSRFHPLKDHDSLLKATGYLAASGRQFRLILAGPGTSAANGSLQEMIAANGLRERILALGPRADIPRIMNALDLHVLSSLSEGFPNVLAEAMACGTPCVTTDVGDAARIVGDTGWTVPAGDTHALATAIAAAFDEMTERRENWSLRREAARARCLSEFSVNQMVRRYHDAWFDM